MRFRHPLAWPQYYYLATPIFLAIDWFAGANLRAVGFAAFPTLRVVYYVVCSICGVIVRLFPAWSAPVTLVESTVNITALTISILTPLYTFDIESPHAALAPFPNIVLNFLIAGTAAMVTFYQSLYSLPGLRRSF
jgi:hypothetical protein